MRSEPLSSISGQGEPPGPGSAGREESLLPLLARAGGSHRRARGDAGLPPSALSGGEGSERSRELRAGRG